MPLIEFTKLVGALTDLAGAIREHVDANHPHYYRRATVAQNEGDIVDYVTNDSSSAQSLLDAYEDLERDHTPGEIERMVARVFDEEG